MEGNGDDDMRAFGIIRDGGIIRGAWVSHAKLFWDLWNKNNRIGLIGMRVVHFGNGPAIKGPAIPAPTIFCQ